MNPAIENWRVGWLFGASGSVLRAFDTSFGCFHGGSMVYNMHLAIYQSLLSNTASFTYPVRLTRVCISKYSFLSFVLFLSHASSCYKWHVTIILLYIFIILVIVFAFNDQWSLEEIKKRKSLLYLSPYLYLHLSELFQPSGVPVFHLLSFFFFFCPKKFL